MVAIVHIYEANGATPTKTRVDGQTANDGTDVRFCTKDAFDPVATSPCIIPASGFNYSYWKHLYLDISDAFTTVNNIRFYTDGGIGWTCGTGGGLFVGTTGGSDNGCPLTSYVQAVGTPDTTGTDIVSGHAFYSAVTDASTYNSGSTLKIDETDHNAPGESKAVVLQVKLHDTATQGTQTDETLTFIYDEI